MTKGNIHAKFNKGTRTAYDKKEKEHNDKAAERPHYLKRKRRYKYTITKVKYTFRFTFIDRRKREK